MLEVRTTFTPFKMKISRREPIVLSVDLRNTGAEKEMVSVDLNLGNQFSLEKSGFKSAKAIRLPEFKPGEKKKFYFDIWPKQSARSGEQPITLLVTEHYQGFNYVKKKYDKALTIAVED
jgi:uncharacterized membrane protein